MSIFALYSMKGGVGKTAAAVNLAYEAVQSGATAIAVRFRPARGRGFLLSHSRKEEVRTQAFLEGRQALGE